MHTEISKIIRRVHNFFVARELTLSVAESCTGGLICHYLTALPGSSVFFEAGVVAYSLEAKRSILCIPAEVIAEQGVVSSKVAGEMAERIRSLTRTDYSLSTTGNLGPDVLENKDKGLIYIAVSRASRTFLRELRLTGEREDNKEMASIAALKFLIEVVQI
ncbi:MAG: CinA family protein [Dissulfurispiraceae bacterium]